MDLGERGQPDDWHSETWRQSVEFVKEHQLEVARLKWGYVVYRTFYTSDPEIEQLWDRALARLRTDIREHFTYEQRMRAAQREEPLDSTPIDLAVNKLELVVLEDREALDGINVKTVREKFKHWVRDNDDPETGLPVSGNVCLMINEESMKSLAESSGSEQSMKDLSERQWVVAIDKDYDEMKMSPHEAKLYLGWMRVIARTLPLLYSDLKMGSFQRTVRARNYEGQIHLYDGGPIGELIDPPGGPDGQEHFGGTQRGPPGGGTGRGTGSGTSRGTESGGVVSNSSGGTGRGTERGGTSRGQDRRSRSPE